MYNSTDFENLFIPNKVEVVLWEGPYNLFAYAMKCYYNLCYKWYKDIHHKLVSVQVKGIPAIASTVDKKSSSSVPLVESTVPQFFGASRKF